MKLKKCKFLIFIIIFSVIPIIKIKAADDIICTYEDMDSKSKQQITTKILMKYNKIESSESQDYYNQNVISYDGINYFYGNNIVYAQAFNIMGALFNQSDQETVQDFYKLEQRCPDYFFAAMETNLGQNIGYGYFTTKDPKIAKQKGIISHYDVRFKLTDDSKVVKKTDKKTGKETLKLADKRKTCSLYANFDDISQNVDITINFTKKNIKFSNATFLSTAITKENYIKKFDYSKDTNCPTDLSLCYDRQVSGIRNYFITTRKKKDSYVNDKYNYNCKPLVKEKNTYKQGTNACLYVENSFTSIETAYNNKKYNEANELIDKLKKYCQLVFEYGNVTDNNKYSCINLCLNVNKRISKLTKTTDVGDCGLSSNIINWIKNILKWVKYILPALVILLGILDFIKAIASGSDDEMKKAQGRFIKRLIAAALLFLIPALIEFVLNIFHIDSAFCGILD